MDALCTAAGLNTAKFRRDDGIDFIITSGSGELIPLLAAQVKSCQILQELEGCWRYDLQAKAYNRLSGHAGIGTPEFLFLVKVPQDPIEYLEVSETALKLRAAVYWLSLEGMADGRKISSSRRISVPRDNLLTPAVLAELFDKASAGIRTVSREETRGGIR